MTLLEYMQEHPQITYVDIARAIGCSDPYPGMIARGKATPSFNMAIMLERYTGGLVPRTNWFPPPDPQINVRVSISG